MGGGTLKSTGTLTSTLISARARATLTAKAMTKTQHRQKEMRSRTAMKMWPRVDGGFATEPKCKGRLFISKRTRPNEPKTNIQREQTKLCKLSLSLFLFVLVKQFGGVCVATRGSNSPPKTSWSCSVKTPSETSTKNRWGSYLRTYPMDTSPKILPTSHGRKRQLPSSLQQPCPLQHPLAQC